MNNMTEINRRKFIKTTSAALVGISLSSSIYGNVVNKKRIKIGQIGTRHSHADEKMAALRSLPDIFEIVGIVENNPQYKSEALYKKEFRGINSISEEKLFNTPGLDAVLIETDFPELIPTAVKCVNAGFNVHIDKPPGKSLNGLRQLFNTAASKRLIVQMGYMFRYNSAFKFLFEAVKKGLIGDILHVDGVISKRIKNGRRNHLATTYGGSMMLLGCHLIDILVAICGRPGKVSSYNLQSLAEDKLYDNELAVFEYPNTTATVRSSLLEVGGMERRQFVVSGTKGTIEIKPLEPPVLNLALDKATEKFQEGYQRVELTEIKSRYEELLLDFAGQIHGLRKPAFSFEHDLIVHEALLNATKIYTGI